MIWLRNHQLAAVAQANPCRIEIPSKNYYEMSDFGVFSRESL